MSFVHTSHGLGEIVQEHTVRGRKSYRVSGQGFNVWLDEADLRYGTVGSDGIPEVNEDNWSPLPYNPDPQWPVQMFQGPRGESTIQPNHKIDPDERLSPSKSLDFSKGEKRAYPGPNPDQFAKSSALHEGYSDGHYDDYNHALNDSEHQEGNEEFSHPMRGMEPNQIGPDVIHHRHEDYWSPEEMQRLKQHTGVFEHPAGLSDKYIQVEAEVDHFNPIQQFRDDPTGFIERRAYVTRDDSHNERYAEYVELLENDPHIREAAWRDVRTKAKRLRSEGAVHVEDIGPGRIYATVDGDNGSYEVLLHMGGVGQTVTAASCDCDWGQHAYNRTTHVGRLCSHQYAALLEMQSRQAKDNSDHPFSRTSGVVDDFKKWTEDENHGHFDVPAMDQFVALQNQQQPNLTQEDVDALYDFVNDDKVDKIPEREYDIPYTLDNDEAYKESAALRTHPESLSPDFQFAEPGEKQHWTDVEEDDRKTTAPDQIVHFSRTALRPEYEADVIQNDLDQLRQRGKGRDENTRQMAEDYHKPHPPPLTYDNYQYEASNHHDAILNSHRLAADEQEGSEGEVTEIPDYRDFDGQGALLDRLRDEIEDSVDDDLGKMDERNDRIRDLVEDLHDKGCDANNLVAHLVQAADYGFEAHPWDDSQQGSGVEHEPFSGSGPSNKYHFESSDDYVDRNERPRFKDVADEEGDIIKYSPGKPEQGPRHQSSLARWAARYFLADSTTDDSTNPYQHPYAPNNYRDPGLAAPHDNATPDPYMPASAALPGAVSTAGPNQNEPGSKSNPHPWQGGSYDVFNHGQPAGQNSVNLPGGTRVLESPIPAWASGANTPPTGPQGNGPAPAGGGSGGMSSLLNMLPGGMGGMLSGLGGMIPGGGQSPGSGPAPLEGQPHLTSGSTPLPGPGAPPPPGMSPPPGEDAAKTYTVNKGDTLSGIAQSQGVKGGYEDIVKANPDAKSVGTSGTDIQKNPNMIHPGDTLKMPGAAPPPPGPDAAPPPENTPAQAMAEPGNAEAAGKPPGTPGAYNPNARGGSKNDPRRFLYSDVLGGNPSGWLAAGQGGLPPPMAPGAVPAPSQNPTPAQPSGVTEFSTTTNPGGEIAEPSMTGTNNAASGTGTTEGGTSGGDGGLTQASRRRRKSYLPPEDFGHTDNIKEAARTDDNSDVVAMFHRQGALALEENNKSDNDIVDAARGFLRTAGRNYSFAEQAALENESHVLGARNLDGLDLRGTHYEDD